METDQQQAQVATASSQPAATSQQSQAQPESTPSAPPPSNSTGATQQAESSSTAVASSATASRPPTAPAAPASPPLPTRHTPQAPGPRAARFQKVLDDSLKHTLGKVTWENFASCYPTVAERAPATLKAAQRQMVDRLAMLCKVCFQDSVPRPVVWYKGRANGEFRNAERI